MSIGETPWHLAFTFEGIKDLRNVNNIAKFSEESPPIIRISIPTERQRKPEIVQENLYLSKVYRWDTDWVL
jgi:hypothetical protein